MRDREHHVDCTITGCQFEADVEVNGEPFCTYHAGQQSQVKFVNDGIVYRIMKCPRGHQWDAYGDWAETELGKLFVPDDPMVLKCPTCRETAEDLDGHDPISLA